MTRRVVLDMDVGIDDAIAILLLASQPDAAIVALGSVFGNIDTAQSTRNAIAVLESVGLGHVPVARGADAPLEVEPTIAEFVHGRDGLGGILPRAHGVPSGESAVDQLGRLGRLAPGDSTCWRSGP